MEAQDTTEKSVDIDGVEAQDTAAKAVDVDNMDAEVMLDDVEMNSENDESYKECATNIYACRECPFQALEKEDGDKHIDVDCIRDEEWYHEEKEEPLDLECVVCCHVSEDVSEYDCNAKAWHRVLYIPL